MMGPPPGGYGAPPGGYGKPEGGYSAPAPQGYGPPGYGPYGYGPQGYGYNPNVPFLYPIECPAANTALTCALVGIFVAGPILELVAIGYGISALRTIGTNPGMQGRGKAISAIAVGCGVYALYAIAIAVAVLTG